LKQREAENVVVVVGGVIPRRDYGYLIDNGVAAVFGPGTNVLDAANSIVDILEGKRRNA
jgi:methylmalonyl-CoA mutase